MALFFGDSQPPPALPVDQIDGDVWDLCGDTSFLPDLLGTGSGNHRADIVGLPQIIGIENRPGLQPGDFFVLFFNLGNISLRPDHPHLDVHHPGGDILSSGPPGRFYSRYRLWLFCSCFSPAHPGLS